MERSLVERAQRGDREAYGRLAADASHRLYAIALRVLRDADQASDVLQDALVDIWQDLPSLRDPDRFEAWSYRVLLNRCRAQRRRAHRALPAIELLPNDGPVGDVQASVAMRDELERGFSALTADQRAILVLRYYRDLGVDEIARTLSVSPGTVKSRLYAAREAMRAALDAQERAPIHEGRTA
jgi:RNA polymerase sigma-70 factor (ECF subfamily)